MLTSVSNRDGSAHRQTIFGNGLTLRPYSEQTDMNVFYKMLIRDKAFRQSIETTRKGNDFKQRYLRGRTTLFESTGEFSFIIERNQDKVIMGFITLDSNYGYSHHVLTISYYMGKKYRRQGYMEKALRMVIDCGFKGKLGQLDDEGTKERRYLIYAFKATADLDNVASIYLLNKLGFIAGGVEYCLRSNDHWPVRDRAHFYLENPNHPPKRAHGISEYGQFVFLPKKDPKTGLPILPAYLEWEY